MKTRKIKKYKSIVFNRVTPEDAWVSPAEIEGAIEIHKKLDKMQGKNQYESWPDQVTEYHKEKYGTKIKKGEEKTYNLFTN